MPGLWVSSSSPHMTQGLTYRSGLSLPLSPDFQEPQFLWHCRAAWGRLLQAVSQRQQERPQAWPLCNNQITGQAGRSDKTPIYFGAFSNTGCPHPTDENGETGSMTPEPVSSSPRRAQAS